LTTQPAPQLTFRAIALAIVLATERGRLFATTQTPQA